MVQQARLARVRPPYQRNPNPLHPHPARIVRREQPLQLHSQRVAARHHLRRWNRKHMLLEPEIDARLHQHQQRRNTLREPAHRLAQPPRKVRLRQRMSGLAPRRDHICNRLHLQQVQLAVQHRPSRQLARLGHPRAAGQAAVYQEPHRHQAAVALKLHHILACETPRGVETDNEHLINRPPAMPKPANRRPVRWRQHRPLRQQPPGNGESLRPR